MAILLVPGVFSFLQRLVTMDFCKLIGPNGV